MIEENDQNKQLPNGNKLTFKELNVLTHLHNAGITKSFGFSCAYIFTLIFCLIFENKNWFCMLESKKSLDVPAKDTDYRFFESTHVQLATLSAFTSCLYDCKGIKTYAP